MKNSITTQEQPEENYFQKAARVLTVERLAGGILAFGAILRLAPYIFNAALYVDEGALALNIIKRSFAGLLQPLDYEQAAPVGFLFLEKLAFLLFGEGERSLRLVPFLFAIVALPLFYEVARRCLQPWAALIALAFFAVSGNAIYFAAQVKQYSGDIAITLLIILLGLEFESKQLTARRWTIFAAVGAIVVWLSHPSVFVLAGVGTALALSAMSERDWPRFWKLAGIYALWVLSFAAFYLISLRNLSGNQTLEKSWAKKGTFMPLVPHSLEDLKWYPGAIVKMFSNPGGLPFPALATIVFIIGCVALFLKNKKQLLMLTAPLLLTMLASGLHKYPFGRRLLLFLIPAVLLVLASGIEYIINKKPPYSMAAGFLVAALLLFQPAGGATSNMLHPYARQDIKPIMAYVRNHKQPGDVIYVYHHQRESFLYYANRYGFNESDYVLGIDARDETKRRADWEAYQKDIDQLRGRSRVWLMFSHIRRIQGIREDEFILQYLNGISTKLDEFIPGETASSSDAEEEPDEFTPAPASAYLYDLGKAAPKSDLPH